MNLASAPATFLGVSERHDAPDFERVVLLELGIEEQRLSVPFHDERTLATIAKHMRGKAFRVTVSIEEAE